MCFKRSDFERGGAKHEPQTARRRLSESKLRKMHTRRSTSGIGERFSSGGRWRWGWFQETHAAAWKSHTHTEKEKPPLRVFQSAGGWHHLEEKKKKTNQPLITSVIRTRKEQKLLHSFLNWYKHPSPNMRLQGCALLCNARLKVHVRADTVPQELSPYRTSLGAPDT